MNATTLFLALTMLVSSISWLGLAPVPWWLLGMLAFVTAVLLFLEAFNKPAVIPLRRSRTIE